MLKIDPRHLKWLHARMILVVGDRYRVLMRKGAQPRSERIAAPIDAVIERGRRDGSIRTDVPADALAPLFGGLLGAGIRLVSEHKESTDDATAYVTALVLDGFGGRPG